MVELFILDIMYNNDKRLSGYQKSIIDNLKIMRFDEGFIGLIYHCFLQKYGVLESVKEYAHYVKTNSVFNSRHVFNAYCDYSTGHKLQGSDYEALQEFGCNVFIECGFGVNNMVYLTFYDFLDIFNEHESDTFNDWYQNETRAHI